MGNRNHRTMIGGQAVIEGVMMRGPKNAALSVRTPEGVIQTETWPTAGMRDRHHLLRLPFVRGIVAFAESMVFGFKCLNRSGEIAGDEPYGERAAGVEAAAAQTGASCESAGVSGGADASSPAAAASAEPGEPGADQPEILQPGGPQSGTGASGHVEPADALPGAAQPEIFQPGGPQSGTGASGRIEPAGVLPDAAPPDAAPQETSRPDPPDDGKSEKSDKLAMAGSMVLGFALALLLFLVLPTTVISLLRGPFSHIGLTAPWLFTLLEGLLRIAIFIAYLAAVSRMKEIQRVYQYHGAEHKSIYCYEHGDELTVENARKYTRLHPRCGTSFLLIVLIVSILVYSFVTWSNPVERVAIHLLLLPLVVGISFEIIHFAGLHDTGVMRFLLGPGLLLQKLTTREPDDSQLEVALTALRSVLTGNPEDDKW